MDKSSEVGKLTPLLTQGAMENVALKVWLWKAGPASHLGRARGLALVVGKQKGWSNGVGMGEQRARAQSLTWSKGEPALGTGKLTD